MNTILSRAVLVLFPALFAAGCANFAAIEPGASAQQIETLAGAPANVWKNADGSEVWEYPRGPFGVETYMVTLGPDRAVREVRQVLSEETISKLQAGMSREDRTRLGITDGLVRMSVGLEATEELIEDLGQALTK